MEAQAPFSVSTYKHPDGPAVVAINGEFDLARIGDFTAALAEAVRDATGIVIDLSGCSFIDSSGLKGLLDAQHTAAGRGQKLVVAIVQPEIRRLFEITALHL